MNAEKNTTIRAAWRNDWSAVRSHDGKLFFESPTFSAAVNALEARESRTVRLMSRPVPHSVDAYWVINARCASYALSAMRRASYV
jgi:hypothetical protein